MGQANEIHDIFIIKSSSPRGSMNVEMTPRTDRCFLDEELDVVISI